MEERDFAEVNDYSLNNNTSISKFASIILEILKEGSTQEQINVLDFLTTQTQINLNDAKAYIKAINKLLFVPDSEVRYYARKAYHKIINDFKDNIDITTEKSNEVSINTIREENKKISTKEILLKKIYLPSRYIAFEAIERLTESGDSTLFESLLEFLKKERDLFKISYLLKRLPKINHPQVAQILTSYLDHSDYRVVANTLEGLYLLNTPELVSKYEELATKSDDHRVKGCSIKVLHKYNKIKAIELLKDMLMHESIAYQDTALNLLKEIYEPQFENLLEIPLQSKFPTIRLKALELYKDLKAIGDKKEVEKTTIKSEEAETILLNAHNYLSDTLYQKLENGFLLSLILIFILLGADIFIPSRVLHKTFIFCAIILCWFLRKNEVLFTRVVATLSFLAGLIWAEYKFLPIFGIVAVWLPFASAITHKNLFPKILLIWMFTLISVVVTNFLQSPNIKLLEYMREFSSNYANNADIVKVSTIYKQIMFMIYFTIVIGNIVLLKIDNLFPTDEKKKNKRLILIFIGLIVSICVIVFFQNLWLKFLFGLSNVEKDISNTLQKILQK